MNDQLDPMVDPGEEPDEGFEAEALQSIPFEVGHSRLIGSDCAGGNALLPPADSCNQRVADLLLQGRNGIVMFSHASRWAANPSLAASFSRRWNPLTPRASGSVFPIGRKD